MSGTLEAVIFDLDGLILDSETPEYLGWKEVYARYGLDLTVKDWAAVVGRRDVDVTAPLRERGADADVEREANRRVVMLMEDYLTPARGFVTLASGLRLAGIRRGLASNSDAAFVYRVIDRLEIRPFFDAVITRDDVAHGKPAPDMFGLIVSILSVEAMRCVALEDSQPGVIAAKAAGLKCIAVPNVFTQHHDLAQADLIVASLEAVTLETLRGLVSPE